MPMDEAEYILTTNRVKVSAAKALLADTTAGQAYGLTPGQRTTLLTILNTIEERMFVKIHTIMGYNDDG